MNKILAILLAGLLMITAGATIVYAEEEEEDGAEVAEENETEENETGEDGEENSVPGFEIVLGAAGLGAARLLRYRNN
ncbi:MAG TPA: PGF-CTERM sorting domain-containing protein [Methanothrix sp.]|nr:PGF-CTERM sorting domain-containing protein [Methanothrix sp.]